MCSPRDATSVATSTPSPRLCKVVMAWVRLLWESPPWIGVASIFCARKFFAILSQLRRVAQKTSAIPGVSCLRQWTSNENLSCA